jgi:hypothetical protein
VVLVVGNLCLGVYGTYFGTEEDWDSGVGLGERVDGPEERSGCVARLSREPVLAIYAPWTRPIETAGKFPSRRVVIMVQHWLMQLKLEVYPDSAVVTCNCPHMRMLL